ncbi:MAG TPA: nucleotide exchange factor GrpE, partial [Kofleriaceae bacterium]|nr:nucleotide exchange factor GrpE [Kofleriaceae bacterium]
MTKTTRNEDIAEVKAAPAGDTPGEPGSGEAGSASGAGDELPLEVEVEAPEPTAEEKIADLEAKNRDLHDKYLRSVAELDNVRKRARKDVDEARIDAQSRALREMLPVIDNLERAVAHAESHADSTAAIVEGVKLVLRQFLQALERCNVRPVAAQDQPFDPNEHEAVSQAETADAA